MSGTANVREGEVPPEPQVKFAAWQEPRPPEDAWSQYCERRRVSGRLRFAFFPSG